ncbi:MAG: glycosyltransferase family 2 protein [Candidatus Endonucleobacter bathymodioli]|uniref:Glycosyltransferase family 2 protein n=1 Tax=Candidatus Endonucleibacter bathymodioli TaxID=539814 RepID=A0AA90NVE6_9GAMM|nr:glycosyltransferase family 2 protein [Candidatus Endonucleobacter bathymodioli]
MQRNKSPFLSCVVPVFNEGEVISSFIPALAEQLSLLTDQFEIIVVDDGSSDNTVNLIEPFHEDFPVKLITLSRNFGKEAALTAGIDACIGEVALLIDADFQHPFAMIPVFLNYWEKGYDMIYGIRKDRRDESFLKKKGAHFFYKIMSFSTGVEVPANAGDFRLMSRNVIDALKSLPERGRFMKGIYAWVGFKSIGIPFDVQERAAGASTWDYRKLTGLALSGITSFTSIPLRMVGIIGLVISLMSVLYALVTIFQTLFLGTDLAGWPTIVTAITFIGGIQLLSLGVLGEYIAGIFNEVKNRPTYLINKQRGFDKEQDDAPTH